MHTTIHKIGNSWSGQPPAVFELVVSDHVSWVDPREYGLERNGINPANYFITSGDAVEKAKVLDRDLWRLAGALRREIFNLIAQEQRCTLVRAQELFRQGVRPRRSRGLSTYEAAVWRTAGQSRKLLAALIRAKGGHCFLETEWIDHQLLCIPKDPRR